MRLLLFTALSTIIFAHAFAQNTKTIYSCPMHPEVVSEKPGKCPKCGMTLEKKTMLVKAPALKKTVRKSPTTPTEPVRGKNLDELTAEIPTPGIDSATSVVYTCVMHPEVQESKPGTCPKCGMALIRKTVTPMAADATLHQAPQADTTAPLVEEHVDLQQGKTVVYHLYARDTIVNFTGKRKKAIAINGEIPAPTLVFTEGDTAEIHLHNMLPEETSLHWHGIILPNRFDGVPLLTTKRIKPGETYTYKFRIVQNGTYWYHSHSALQEQVGMYGALILKKRDQTDGLANVPIQATDQHHPSDQPGATANPVKHYNVVLSEWANDNPMQIHRRLRTGNDWFSIRKGSTQSYSEAIREGHFKTKLVNEWKRMKAMDVSDVFYDKFLINGKPVNNAMEFKAGDRVRLHIVNAGASSYFWLTWGGGKITVVGNDGNDVVPVQVDRLIIAVAETYDVEVTIPDDRSYEFRSTSEDRTGYASLWLGTGAKVNAMSLPRLKYFEGMKMMNDMMNTNGTMNDMGMKMSLQKMDMNMVMYPEITGSKDDSMPGMDNNSRETEKDSTLMSTEHSMHGMPAGSDIVTLNYDMLRSPF
jgi:FtsP/CotA-like multicopper oxidase with cupredoxin domain